MKKTVSFLTAAMLLLSFGYANAQKQAGDAEYTDYKVQLAGDAEYTDYGRQQ